MGALHCSFTAAVAHGQPPRANVGDTAVLWVPPLPVVQVNFLLCDELSNEVSVSAVALAKVVLGEELTAAVFDKVKENKQNRDNEQNGNGMVQKGRH